VLLAVDAYLPWSGGSRVYYHNLYRRLAHQHGLTIRVETSHCSGEDQFDAASCSPHFDIRRDGERLTDWKSKRAPVLAQKLLHIVRAAVQTSPAAIHCGDLFPQDFAGLLLRKAAGLPFLVFVHGDEISQTDGRRLQPHVRNSIYRAADCVVAANSYAYDRAVAICGSSERVTMITPGVDCDAFRPGERPEWISREFSLGDSPVIVTVARLVKKKGHETVLRSLPAVLKRVPDLKYLVVGEGPEELKLKQLAAHLGIERHVRFAGNVPHPLLADFYRAGDVFCMINQQDASGDIESFGMVFIEASASGKPVIGGRSGGTGQSIVEGQTGFLCEPCDSERLGHLLVMLLQRTALRQRMGEAGVLRARGEFNWDLRAQRLLELHRGIVESKPRPLQRSQSCPAR
jgi:phosphatidylinositol alpha-1,6-mannosyltransferase